MRTFTLTTVAAVAVLAAGAGMAQPPGGGRGGMTPEQREAAFATADANKDGKLDKAEFATTLPEQVRQAAEQIFPNRDANSDGFISKEEFMAPGRGGRGGGRGGPPGGAPPAGQ